MFELIATDEYGVGYVTNSYDSLDEVYSAMMDAPEGSELEEQLRELFEENS